MKATFYIIDGEFNKGDAYEYEGYFVTYDEIKEFMMENVKAGSGIMLMKVEFIEREELETLLR